MIFNSAHSGQHNSQVGFTLIELLVVLVVMGIVLGMTAVKFMPDDRAVLRDEAQRLALLLENAGMEARASGRSLAWSPEGNGYRFWRLDDYGTWVRIDNDAAFRPRTFPEGVHITSVTVEMQPLQPEARLLLGAATFNLPFRIVLGNAHGQASVIGGSTGSVTFESGEKVTAGLDPAMINGHS